MNNVNKTETDLEASINRVISKIKWISSGQIRHQVTFSIVVGTKTIPFTNSDFDYKKTGRADIILYDQSNEPLAVLELKRSGIKLQDEDMEQGRSYALLLKPKVAPLVIVSNGHDTRFYEAYSGKPWKPNNKTEASFKELISNVATLADANIASAISTLMGVNVSVWKCAVEQATNDFLKKQTANKNSPFLEDFNIPRIATKEVIDLLTNRQRLIVVKGDPLSGKSNILKQISSQKKFITLYLDVSGSEGIYQIVSRVLSDYLDWPFSEEEARSWLLQISKHSSQQLVLLVDGCEVNNENVIKQIATLSSQSSGNSLSLVVSMDSNCADKIYRGNNRRSLSKIGMHANNVNVANGLTDSEFVDVEDIFKKKNIFFENGAKHEPYYRQPWILRAIFCAVKDKSSINLPPFLDKTFLQLVDSEFDDNELIRLFSKLAEQFISRKYEKCTEDPILILQRYNFYFFYRTELEKLFNEKDFDFLLNYGYLKILEQKSQDQILLANVPELLVSRVIENLVHEILCNMNSNGNIDDIAHRLIQKTFKMPLGSFIAAQSINKAMAIYSKESLLMFSKSLLNIEPIFTSFSEGTKLLAYLPNGETKKISLDGELVKQRGKKIDAWLTLSYLLMYIYEDNEGELELDEAYSDILLKLGSFQSILKSPNTRYDLQEHYSHTINEELELPCNMIGISEPITYAIFLFLQKSKKEDVYQWLDKVMDKKSVALLNRISIALIKLKERSIFFDEIYRDKIHPEFDQLFSLISPQIH